MFKINYLRNVPLGDRIAVMKEGHIAQLGTKQQLCEFPKTAFVEQLVQAGLRG